MRVDLEEKCKDSGLHVLGVAVHERARTADEGRTKLDAWLTKNFADLNSRVAFGYTGDVNEPWMEPSFSCGIPISFVLDRDGHIAFGDHPARLYSALPRFLKGIWRISDEAKPADTEWIAQGQRRTPETTRKRTLTESIFAKLRPAKKAQGWVTALLVVKQALTVMPGEINCYVLHADLLLHKMHDMWTGQPIMRERRSGLNPAIPCRFSAAVDGFHGYWAGLAYTFCC